MMKKILFLLLCVFSLTTMQGSFCYAASVKCILRYDDYSLTSNTTFEKQLFQMADDLGIGIIVGVIPFVDRKYNFNIQNSEQSSSNLPADKVLLLKEYIRKGIVMIAVHGYAHKNNSTNRNISSEFASQDYEFQYQALLKAKKALENSLGQKVSLFIPPYNTYDKNTLIALHNAGYKLILARIGGTGMRGDVGYLPSREKDFVLLNETDAVPRESKGIITPLLHEYDFIENGESLPEYRHGKGQLSLIALKNNLLRMRREYNIEFVCWRDIKGDDFSYGRYLMNEKLINYISKVLSKSKLLPWYPDKVAYYSKDTAAKICKAQLLLGAAFLCLICVSTGIILKKVMRAFNSMLFMRIILILVLGVLIIGIWYLCKFGLFLWIASTV